jgi:HK97 family phage major capsid protein
MNRLEEIRARLEAIRARLAEIEGLAEPEGDEAVRSAALTARADETDVLLAEWDTLEAERVPLQARHDRLEAVRSASLRPSNTESGDGSRIGGHGPEIKRNRDPYEDLELVRSGRYADGDVIERAKFAIDQAPKYLDDGGRAHAMRLVEMDTDDDSRQAPLIARHMLLTGSQDYRRQYAEYMRTGYAGELLRAALSLTDANGGYLVPFTLDPTIILTNAGIIDPIRSMATVVQIATDSWNGVSSAGTTSGWTAEAAEATEGNPTFAAPSITPKRADSFVTGSYEVLSDSGFASQLGRLLADAKARLEGAAFATANTGATRPRGVVAAVAAVTTSIVASATTNALVIADVYAVDEAMPARYSAQSQWIANKKIQNKIRQFDTTGSAAFWANLGMGRPKELLGQPIKECSTMQSAVTTAGLVLLAGDFSMYQIVDRIGMSTQYVPVLMGTTNHRPTGEAGWFAFWRVGADVLDAGAFRLLQLNSTAAAVALA